MLPVPYVFDYATTHIEGWTVRYERALENRHAEEWRAAKEELGNHLYRIRRTVASTPLKRLREVTVWVHWNDPGTTCMAFHPAPEWLREHHMNPDMTGSIEIGNVRNFLLWTHEQPWMVLHELAHAYHFRVLEKGFDNADVKGVFDGAILSKRYEHVLHWDGKSLRHYAATNPMEFFAEATEAYFGQNDFFPFVNSELKTAEPDTYALMVRVWGLPARRG